VANCICHSCVVGNHSALGLAVAAMLVLDMTARAGVISGSVNLTTDPGSTNLTTQGTDDWATWGGTSNETEGTTTPFDEKNIITHDIQGMTLLGGLTVAGTTDRIDQNGTYTWSDGTNTPTQSSPLPMLMQAFPPGGGPTDGPATGTGFELKFNASNDLSRTLTLTLAYVDVNASVTATLSDGSAAPYSNAVSSTTDAAASFAVYTITYSANSPGQTLTVDFTTTASNGDYDNIAVEAASLSAVAIPEPASIALLAAGACGLLARPRSRRRRA
jgi:hypothetical protein